MAEPFGAPLGSTATAHLRHAPGATADEGVSSSSVHPQLRPASPYSTPASPLSSTFVARPPRTDSRLQPVPQTDSSAAAPPSPSMSNMASALRRSAARRETVQFTGDKHALSSFAAADASSSSSSFSRPRSNSAAIAGPLLDAFVPLSTREARTRSPTPSSTYESASESTPRQATIARTPLGSATLTKSAPTGPALHSPRSDTSYARASTSASHALLSGPAPASLPAQVSPPASPISEASRDGNESSDSQDWKGVDGDFASSPLKSPLLSLLAGEQDHMNSIVGAMHDERDVSAEVIKEEDERAYTTENVRRPLKAAPNEGPWWKSSTEASPVVPHDPSTNGSHARANTSTTNGDSMLPIETSPSQVGKALDWDESQPSRPSTPQPSAYVPSRPSLGTPPLSRQSSRQSSPARSNANSPSAHQDHANTTSSPLAASPRTGQAYEPVHASSLAQTDENASDSLPQAASAERAARDRSSSAGIPPATGGTTRRPARRELPMPPPEKSSKRTSVMKLKKQQEQQQTSGDAVSRDAAPQQRPSITPTMSPRSQELADTTPRSQDPQRLSLYSFADSDSRHGLTQPNTPLSATDFVETYGGNEFGRTSSVDGSVSASRPSSYYTRGSLSNDFVGSSPDLDSLSRDVKLRTSVPEQLASTEMDLSSAMLSFGISEQDETLQPSTSRAHTPASHQESLNNRQSSEVSDDVFHDAPMVRVGSSDPTQQHAAVSENSRATTPLPLHARTSPLMPTDRKESSRADAKARAAAFVADLKRAATPTSTTQPSPGHSSDATSPSLYVAAVSPAPSPMTDLAPGHDSSSSSSRKESPLPPPPPQLPPAPPQVNRTAFSPSAPIYASSALSAPARTSQTSLSPSSTAPPPPELNAPGQIDYLGGEGHAAVHMMPRYKRLHRRRALPPALQIAPDLRRCHTAGDRAAVYFGKIVSLRHETSGLQDWISAIRGGLTPVAGGGGQQHSPFDRSRRAREDSSSSTFPNRGEGARAREILPASLSPRDSVSPLPYPGVSGKFASKTAGNARAALFGLGRKASKRSTTSISGPAYGASSSGSSSTSTTGRPNISGPTNLTTSASLAHLISIQSLTSSNKVGSLTTAGGGGISGTRMPRPSLDSTTNSSSVLSSASSTTLAAAAITSSNGHASSSYDDNLGKPLFASSSSSAVGVGSNKFAANSLSSTSFAADGAGGGSGGSYAGGIVDDDKLERLYNILPTASREGLVSALTKAGGDEVLAVSVYLSDEGGRR
ncbi:hypothetical protein ACM66B_001090 [Microbotryomycetes sp. NB124-2]